MVLFTTQRQIAQGIKFGQRPLSLRKSEEGEGSSDEEEVPRSPLKVLVQVETEPPKMEPKVNNKLFLLIFSVKRVQQAVFLNFILNSRPRLLKIINIVKLFQVCHLTATNFNICQQGFILF